MYQPHAHIYPAKVDSSGRIVLPAETRARKGLKEGDTLVIVEDADGAVRLQTYEEVVRGAQAYFCGLIPSNIRLVDELLAERREDAARD